MAENSHINAPALDQQHMDKAAGQLFSWWATGIGFLLLILGASTFFTSRIPDTFSNLVASAGLGVILGSLGAMVTSKTAAKLGVTGVGAITLILLGTLGAPPCKVDTHVVLSGDGMGLQDGEEHTKVRANHGQITFLGGHTSSDYGFIIEDGHQPEKYLNLSIAFVDEEGEGEPIQFEITVDNLVFGEKNFFEYDAVNGEIGLYPLAENQPPFATEKIRQSRENQRNREPGTNVSSSRSSSTSSLISQNNSWSWIPSAYADHHFPRVLSARDQKKFLALAKQLQSRFSNTRRKARKKLAALGPTVTTQLMLIYKKQDGKKNYRNRLGVLVALSKMLTSKKTEATSVARQVSQHLSVRDLSLLLDATNHKDETMRYWATEFLYRLEDPRILQPAQKKLKLNQFGDDGRINTLITLKPIFHKIDAQQKGRLVKELAQQSVNKGPETKKQIRWFQNKYIQNYGVLP